MPDAAASPDSALARRALALLDLTDLADDASEAGMERLVAAAEGPGGPVAALCVWPHFVTQVREALGSRPIHVATVINFPHGGTDIERAVEDTRAACRDGADEIDLVMPYRAFLAGDTKTPHDMIAAVKETLPRDARLKVILETGALGSLEAIKEASLLAIAAGADFLKTSTGKLPASATPMAVEAMLDVIDDAERPVGLKVSGGLHMLADAAVYLALVDLMMGEDWATPDTFRFGASRLHVALRAAVG